MSAFKKGNVFHVGCFDSIDAILFFLLAAILSFSYHILPFELPTEALGPIIAFFVVLTFFQRHVYFPKVQEQKISPTMLSPLGLIAVLLVAIGFAFSLFGFHLIYNWSDYKPKEIDQTQIETTLKQRLETAKIQEQLMILSSFEEVYLTEDEIEKKEKVSIDEFMEDIETETEALTALKKDQIKMEIIKELNLELEKENLETQEHFRNRGFSLVSVGFSLLFFAVLLKKMRHRLHE